MGTRSVAEKITRAADDKSKTVHMHSCVAEDWGPSQLCCLLIFSLLHWALIRMRCQRRCPGQANSPGLPGEGGRSFYEGGELQQRPLENLCLEAWNLNELAATDSVTFSMGLEGPAREQSHAEGDVTGHVWITVPWGGKHSRKRQSLHLLSLQPAWDMSEWGWV